VPVKFSEIFFGIYLNGGPLLRLGQPKSKPPGYIAPSVQRLKLCVAEIKTLFDFLTNLGQSAFAAFTSNDWTKFVLSIILAVRLSFPLTELPCWDCVWARNELHFDEFMNHMCDGADLTTVNTRVDAFSAGRVVMRVVKQKYDQRVALHTRAAAAAAAEAAAAMTEMTTSSVGIRGCPMFDHSMEPYIAAWDTGFDVGTATPPPIRRMEDQQPVFHDLWATMTMGWADDLSGNIE
jgi:hypothetical protein